MNIENTLNTAIKTLTQFNIQNANLDSEILLAKIIGKDRNYIILNSKEHLSQKYLFRFSRISCKRMDFYFLRYKKRINRKNY